VRDEGGDAAARTAALNIVKSELVLQRQGKLLGGMAPWFILNPLSKRIEFMHLETRFSDMFTEAWKTTTRQLNQQKSIEMTKSVVDATPEKLGGPKRELEAAANPVAAALPEPAPKKGRRGDANGGGPTPEKKDDPQKAAQQAAKKQEQKQLNELKNLRSKLLGASASGRAVLELIKTSPEWAYFKTESSMAPLNDALHSVELFLQSNDFWNNFAVFEPVVFVKSVRKHFTDEDFKANVSKKHELELLVARIERETVLLKKMHAARQ
jgi:hypothetical protein